MPLFQCGKYRRTFTAGKAVAKRRPSFSVTESVAPSPGWAGVVARIATGLAAVTTGAIIKGLANRNNACLGGTVVMAESRLNVGFGGVAGQKFIDGRQRNYPPVTSTDGAEFAVPHKFPNERPYNAE